MSNRRETRRINDLQRRISSWRASASVLEEQVRVWLSATEESRLKCLMSETPLATADYSELARQSDVALKELSRLKSGIEEMVAERDSLLRNWSPKELI